MALTSRALPRQRNYIDLALSLELERISRRYCNALENNFVAVVLLRLAGISFKSIHSSRIVSCEFSGRSTFVAALTQEQADEFVEVIQKQHPRLCLEQDRVACLPGWLQFSFSSEMFAIFSAQYIDSFLRDRNNRDIVCYFRHDHRSAMAYLDNRIFDLVKISTDHTDCLEESLCRLAGINILPERSVIQMNTKAGGMSDIYVAISQEQTRLIEEFFNNIEPGSAFSHSKEYFQSDIPGLSFSVVTVKSKMFFHPQLLFALGQIICDYSQQVLDVYRKQSGIIQFTTAECVYSLRAIMGSLIQCEHLQKKPTVEKLIKSLELLIACLDNPSLRFSRQAEEVETLVGGVEKSIVALGYLFPDCGWQTITDVTEQIKRNIFLELSVNTFRPNADTLGLVKRMMQ